MTPSRMMTRQKAHPQARACLAAAVAAVACGLLGAAEDPLREAKEVLGRPGLLSSDLRA